MDVIQSATGLSLSLQLAPLPFDSHTSSMALDVWLELLMRFSIITISSGLQWRGCTSEFGLFKHCEYRSTDPISSTDDDQKNHRINRRANGWDHFHFLNFCSKKITMVPPLNSPPESSVATWYIQGVLVFSLRLHSKCHQKCQYFLTFGNSFKTTFCHIYIVKPWVPIVARVARIACRRSMQFGALCNLAAGHQ